MRRRMSAPATSNRSFDAVIRIDHAGPDDAEVLARFASRAFIDAYGADNPPEHVREYAKTAFAIETVRRQLADPATVFLIAKHGSVFADQGKGEIAYVKLCKDQAIEELADPAPMQLERIYVDQTSQSSGLGRMLLDATFDLARHDSIETIWLAVWEKNERAQRFYARNGFEVVGKTYFMLGPERQEDLVLARKLA